MRWMGGGTLRPPRKRGMASARDAFQRQRAVNMGASSMACVRTCSTVCGFRNSNTNSSGKACCSVSEMLMPLSVAAACSSKVERPAEALAQRQSPRPIDARSEGRVDHQLHPAAFIEEALCHHGLLSRQSIERRRAREHIRDSLLGAAFIEPAIFHQELHRAVRRLI